MVYEHLKAQSLLMSARPEKGRPAKHTTIKQRCNKDGKEEKFDEEVGKSITEDDADIVMGG